MKTTCISLIIALGAATIFSCKKYDDGPRLSLRTKKARVANEWQFDKVTFSNGQDLTAGFADNSIEFDKDGTYTERDGTSTITGTWKFASDKEDLVLSPDNNSAAQLLHILRLKEKEFWFTNELNNGVYTYHLSAK